MGRDGSARASSRERKKPRGERGRSRSFWIRSRSGSTSRAPSPPADATADPTLCPVPAALHSTEDIAPAKRRSPSRSPRHARRSSGAARASPTPQISAMPSATTTTTTNATAATRPGVTFDSATRFDTCRQRVNIAVPRSDEDVEFNDDDDEYGLRSVMRDMENAGAFLSREDRIKGDVSNNANTTISGGGDNNGGSRAPSLPVFRGTSTASVATSSDGGGGGAGSGTSTSFVKRLVRAGAFHFASRSSKSAGDGDDQGAKEKTHDNKANSTTSRSDKETSQRKSSLLLSPVVSFSELAQSSLLGTQSGSASAMEATLLSETLRPDDRRAVRSPVANSLSMSDSQVKSLRRSDGVLLRALAPTDPTMSLADRLVFRGPRSTTAAAGPKRGFPSEPLDESITEYVVEAIDKDTYEPASRSGSLPTSHPVSSSGDLLLDRRYAVEVSDMNLSAAVAAMHAQESQPRTEAPSAKPASNVRAARADVKADSSSASLFSTEFYTKLIARSDKEAQASPAVSATRAAQAPLQSPPPASPPRRQLGMSVELLQEEVATTAPAATKSRSRSDTTPKAASARHPAASSAKASGSRTPHESERSLPTLRSSSLPSYPRPHSGRAIPAPPANPHVPSATNTSTLNITDYNTFTFGSPMSADLPETTARRQRRRRATYNSSAGTDTSQNGTSEPAPPPQHPQDQEKSAPSSASVPRSSREVEPRHVPVLPPPPPPRPPSAVSPTLTPKGPPAAATPNLHGRTLSPLLTPLTCTSVATPLSSTATIVNSPQNSVAAAVKLFNDSSAATPPPPLLRSQPPSALTTPTHLSIAASTPLASGHAPRRLSALNTQPSDPALTSSGKAFPAAAANSTVAVNAPSALPSLRAAHSITPQSGNDENDRRNATGSAGSAMSTPFGTQHHRPGTSLPATPGQSQLSDTQLHVLRGAASSDEADVIVIQAPLHPNVNLPRGATALSGLGRAHSGNSHLGFPGTPHKTLSPSQMRAAAAAGTRHVPASAPAVSGLHGDSVPPSPASSDTSLRHAGKSPSRLGSLHRARPSGLLGGTVSFSPQEAVLIASDNKTAMPLASGRQGSSLPS